MRKILDCRVSCVILALGCSSLEPTPVAWAIQETERGLVAVQDNWIVVAQNGDVLPDSGVVTGVAAYYKLEPVGGGGIYDLAAEELVWNEWVPLLVPTRPGYSALRSWYLDEATLVIAFEDSVGPRADMLYPHQEPLKFDLRITRSYGGALEMELGGMHMVFPSVRMSDTVTIDVQSQNKPDTTLVVAQPCTRWSFDFAGPSSYEYESSHFHMLFETDAPYMKVGIGDIPGTDFIKFDLDHSLPVGVEYVHSNLIVRPNF